MSLNSTQSTRANDIENVCTNATLCAPLAADNKHHATRFVSGTPRLTLPFVSEPLCGPTGNTRTTPMSHQRRSYPRASLCLCRRCTAAEERSDSRPAQRPGQAPSWYSLPTAAVPGMKGKAHHHDTASSACHRRDIPQPEQTKTEPQPTESTTPEPPGREAGGEVRGTVPHAWMTACPRMPCSANTPAGMLRSGGGRLAYAYAMEGVSFTEDPPPAR